MTDEQGVDRRNVGQVAVCRYFQQQQDKRWVGDEGSSLWMGSDHREEQRAICLLSSAQRG